MINTPKIYKIAASENFFQSLSLGTIARFSNNCNQEDVITLLPTKYSCNSLKKSFNELGFNLERIYPIGDLSGLVFLKTTYKVLNRFELVSRISQMIIKMNIPNFNNLSNVTHLSEYFADFIYNVELYQVNLKDILKVIDDDLSIHKQDIFSILKEFMVLWSSNSYTTKAGYNNLLIDKLTKKLPQKPLIMAGISSNIPSVVNLMKAVKNSKNGFLVFYGLDTNLNDDDWNNIESNHSQYHFKKIISKLNIDLNSINNWGRVSDVSAKSIFISNALKPAKSCANWHKTPLIELTGLHYLSCIDQHHEAKEIVQILKAQNYKNAMIVTPDDSLMIKLILQLKKSGIEANIIRDYPLGQSNSAILLKLCLDFVLKEFSILSGLTLLKHNLVDISLDVISEIEILARDKSFRSNNIFHIEYENDQFSKICSAAKIFKEAFSSYSISFAEILDLHIEFANTIAKEGSLWESVDGKELKEYLDLIKNNSEILGSINPKDYHQIFNHFLKSAYYRLEEENKSITLLKPIDARLHNADLVIMAGANENIWPKKHSISPCVTKGLLKKIQLPLPEELTGEEAYDFQCLAQSKTTFITRSEKIFGVSTIPSRWVLRILTLAKKMHLKLDYTKTVVNGLDDKAKLVEVNNDFPVPPLELRPQKLSVTQLEKLVFNPYHIYVDLILKLKKLPEIKKEISALDFGVFVHKALEIYNIKKNKGLDYLISAGEESLLKLNLNNSKMKLIYWSRFIRIAKWFIENENIASKVYLEEYGQIRIVNNFILSARADRIEVLPNNYLNIIDYKTGSLPTKKSIFSGKSLQLLLEAVIGKKGGYNFQKHSQKINSISYVQLTGGENPIEVLDVDITNDSIIEQSEKYINDLVANYQDSSTPYYYTKKKKTGYCEYSHLARKFT